METTMTRKHIAIIEQAKKLVSTRREDTYGNKKANHTNIAKLWSAYLDKKITPKDIANSVFAFLAILDKSTGNIINVDGGVANAFVR